MGNDDKSFEIIEEASTTCTTITIENGTRDDEVVMLPMRPIDLRDGPSSSRQNSGIFFIYILI